MTTLAWAVLFAPLASSLTILGFALRRPKAAGWIATGTMALAFLMSLGVLFQVPHAGHAVESSFVWISLGRVPIELGVLIDGLSTLMLLIVTGIGSLIFLYSTSYMEHDEGYARYFAWLSLFAFSMLGIVLSNNLIQTFIFWELVGLSSYLLIGFFYQKPEAATAGKKAFLTTRVGDVGMMIGILLLYGIMARNRLGSFNFLFLHEHMPEVFFYPLTMTVIALLLFMGVAGKSGQMPLHVWLPDAMEGPTPVSALIHAATMVAAGVYLLARLFFIFAASKTALIAIAWIGGFTALIMGTVALVQTDIKKILAYSTLSQLGYMVLALGLRNPEAGMFHLTTHAFFKALLFLGAGSLIHSLHTQNIWEMYVPGGLFKKMPVTSWTFLIGTLALMGIPPFSGFFSKEEIIATARYGPLPLFAMASLTVFLTSFYMGRLFTIVFLNQHMPEHAHVDDHAHESGPRMAIPLIILAVFSLISGFFPVGHMISAHPHHFPASLKLTFFAVGLGVAGFLAAFALYCGRHKAPGVYAGALTFPKRVLENKYFFDEFYDRVVIRFVQENIARVSDAFERIVVVEAGVNGLARATRACGDALRRLQTGIIQFYIFVFAAGVTVMLITLMVAGKL